MALADWVLGGSRGGLTSEQKKQINESYKPGSYGHSTYSGLGRKPNSSSSSGGSSSKGSSGGSSSGGGASVPAYDPYAAYQAQLQAIYEEQRRAAEEAERRKREAAQAAYDRNMAALGSAYQNQLSGLKQNYESTLGTLENDYNQGVDGVNKQADNAQQQAYINYMMSKRDLGQQMSAQGLSGGAAESTLAGLYNEYGNSRNTIDSGRNDNLASLRNSYDSSKASALQSYNGQLSDAEAAKLAYEMQLEQNLANAIADAASVNYDQQFALSQNYLSQLSDIQQAQAAATQKASAQSYSAGNSTRSVSTRQAGVAGSGSNAYRLAQQVYSSYQNPDDVVDALMLSGVSNQDILDILNQMGIN